MNSASADAAPRAPAILCAGIIALDEVFRVEKFPRPDVKTPAHSFFVVNGGCAANAAVAVARLGGRAALAGPLGGPPGEDSNGDRVLAALARERVDCSGCQRVAGISTPLSAIFIDARGERMIVTHRDCRLDAARPADPAGLVASVDALLADNRFPEFVRPICVAARARGISVVLDADGPTPMGDDLLRIASHVVFSSEGLRATTGLDDLGAALARIADTTPSFLAVTRRRAGRSLVPGTNAARKPGLRGRGGRHARRGRCVPRRLHARARGGSRRDRGDALCGGGGRAQMHPGRRQRRGAAARRGRSPARGGSISRQRETGSQQTNTAAAQPRLTASRPWRALSAKRNFAGSRMR